MKVSAAYSIKFYFPDLMHYRPALIQSDKATFYASGKGLEGNDDERSKARSTHARAQASNKTKKNTRENLTSERDGRRFLEPI